MSFMTSNIMSPARSIKRFGVSRRRSRHASSAHLGEIVAPTVNFNGSSEQTHRNELTGSFTTERLPRIAPGSVTVTIARTLNPGCDAEFAMLSTEMMSAVTKFPGCLGATMLQPGAESVEYHSVFRFIDVIHLRKWERSAERDAILAKLDKLISTERVTVTAGSADFYITQTQAQPHRTAVGSFFSDIAWVYPLALGYTIVLGPVLDSLSIFVRALVFTIVIGLTSRIALTPIKLRWHRRRMLPQDKQVSN